MCGFHGKTIATQQDVLGSEAEDLEAVLILHVSLLASGGLDVAEGHLGLQLPALGDAEGLLESLVGQGLVVLQRGADLLLGQGRLSRR